MTFDARAVAWLRDRYFSVDRRVLGLFRIAMGAVLLADVVRRLPYAAMYYSDAGVLPAALVRERPPGDEVFSLFFWLESPRAAQIGMLVVALIFLAYLVGYRTRLAQLLALVAFASLNARNVLVENRGHVEMSIALVWTLALPLGDRYSVDALLRRADDEPAEAPFVSLAVAAITLQVAAIYLLNALQKGGTAWDSGQAVHYVLWQNRAATSFAAWLRLNEPSWLSPVLTSTTLWAEGLCAAAVLSPFGQRYARTALLLLALGLHGSIALAINVWPHSFVIGAVDLLFLPPVLLDRVVAMAPVRRAARWLRGLTAGARPRATVPLRRASERTTMLREGAVAVMLVAVLFRIGLDNAKVPAPLRPRDLGWLDPLIRWPRLYQRWSMFAEVPLDDGTLVVDAVTAAGVRVDPLTGGAPDLQAPAHGPWLLSQLQCDYYLKIQRADHVAYVPALVSYLTRWHALEGRPESERLESFEVYWVSNDSPRPGSTQPTRIQSRILARYPRD